MTDQTTAAAILHAGEPVVIRKDVPTWGGDAGTVVRVAFDGSCQVRLGRALLLWFEKDEVESDA